MTENALIRLGFHDCLRYEVMMMIIMMMIMMMTMMMTMMMIMMIISVTRTPPTLEPVMAASTGKGWER